MAISIIPAFARFPKEAEIVGRLLAGYGEIEWEICTCLGEAIDDNEAAARALYRTRGEKQRIDIADALMRHLYNKAGMLNDYVEAISAAHWCRRIRNQFSHCRWWDDPNGLYFLDLERGAQAAGPVMAKVFHIDIGLLEKQETFFRYTLTALTYLNREIRVRDGRLKNHRWTMPHKSPKPPLHTPPQKYRPPEVVKDWLQDQQALPPKDEPR